MKITTLTVAAIIALLTAAVWSALRDASRWHFGIGG